jgi:hypothetical protein
MRRQLSRRAVVWTAAIIALSFLAAGAPAAAEDTDLPTVIKTRPTFVSELLAQSANPTARSIQEDSIVRVQVNPRGSARGFAYFDSLQMWRNQFGLARPEDLDNDGETRRWKLVGGMSLDDKHAEFDALGEGGAPLGTVGTGIIDVEVWHRVDGDVTCTSLPVRVGMKKLYVEVDWFEGSFRKRVTRGGETLTISCKPVVDQRFVEAFGQCGLEVVVCDSPETGNTKNVIPADAMFDKRHRLNCENLSSLVDREFRDETDATALNEGTSLISRWLVENGYVNLDPSRPDTVYMIGVQRWSKRGPALGRTMGVVCLLEYEGSLPGRSSEGTANATPKASHRMPMAFIFTRSIAESTASVNGKQRTQVPFDVAARHTAIHEVAAHCFPVEWNNSRTSEHPDPYWSRWRYLYAGHPRRPEAQDDYYRTYETCVTCAETGLDSAYYTFTNAPRLNDFRWRMANCVDEKTRDIIRDYAIDGQSHYYGHPPTVRTKLHSVADAREQSH